MTSTPVGSKALIGLLGEWRADAPAYEALADRVRLLLIDGRLAAESRLPAERDLAERLSSRYRAIFTPADGARSSYGGVQTPTSNPRVMHYYGFYRVDTQARVLIECGAGVTDDAFLQKTDLIATAISGGVTDYLRARGLL